MLHRNLATPGNTLVKGVPSITTDVHNPYVGYPLPPYPRQPAKPAAEPARVPAAEALLARETFADKPWLGSSFGEMLPPPVVAPPRQPARGLEIDPPPWQAELESGDFDLASLAPSEPTQQLSALEAMNPESPPWTARQEFALPDRSWTPLTRPQFDPPNWTQEQIERNRKERPTDEPARSLQRRPA